MHMLSYCDIHALKLHMTVRVRGSAPCMPSRLDEKHESEGVAHQTLIMVRQGDLYTPPWEHQVLNLESHYLSPRCLRFIKQYLQNALRLVLETFRSAWQSGKMCRAPGVLALLVNNSISHSS